MTEEIKYNEEQYLGYKFYIQDELDYAFDSERKVLVVFEKENTFLAGMINFTEVEGEYKIKFRNVGAIILESFKNEVWLTLERRY